MRLCEIFISVRLFAQEGSTDSMSQEASMPSITRAVAAALILVLLLLPLNSAPAQSGGLTVGQLLIGLKGLVSQLEESSESLLEQGNNYASQQQMLLAGTIQAAIERIEKAYADSLQSTYDAFTVAEANAFSDLEELLKNLDHTALGIGRNLDALVYKTQGGMNQILDRLPLIDRYPTYYGLRTRDLLRPVQTVPHDIEILGFLLVDPKLDYRKPKVVVAGTILPDKLISAQQDRILVELPPGLKQRLKLENKPCDPSRSFQVALTVYYHDGSLLRWFNPRYQGNEVHLTGRALPGNPTLTVEIQVEGERTREVPQTFTFEKESHSVSVGCEKSKSKSLSWPAPEGARQIDAKAKWVKTKRLKDADANTAVSGLTVTASGKIRGKDKELGINCRGGGKGKLRLYGTYVLNRADSTAMAHQAQAVMTEGVASFTAPLAEGTKLKRLTINLRRRGCSVVLDQIEVPLPPDLNQTVRQTSQRGLFEAKHQRGQITVRLSVNAAG